MKHTNGSETIYSSGPWAQLVAVRQCLCEDGDRRYVQITGQPDTVFSVPARTKVKGKTVSGFLTFTDTNPNLSGDLPLFVATGKNKGLIPGEYLQMVRREYRRKSWCHNPPSVEAWDWDAQDYR